MRNEILLEHALTFYPFQRVLKFNTRQYMARTFDFTFIHVMTAIQIQTAIIL